MPIVTLITDLGTSDFYLSMVKAKLLSEKTQFEIVDISHDVAQFDIAQAAFVLKNVMEHFPAGTIHLMGVATGSTDHTRHLAIEYNGQYIITADNGFFSLIAEKQPDLIVELRMNLDTDFKNFPLRDLYTKAAAHILRGGTLEVIGKRTDDYLNRTMFQPTIGDGYISGVVAYVYNYGNAITNIHQSLIKQVGKGRDYLIGFTQKGYELHSIEERYEDTSEGDRVAIINSAGYLEIAIMHGNASQLLGLERGETVIISFDG
ncbi:MAG: SAM-dependent chlorinase/fluorinase [Salibacteraceae bacterium]